MRVFPDIPVCVKGNETRMGKGKGSFEYWACRVPLGRVVFEVGGGGIREEIAKQGMSSSLRRLRFRRVRRCNPEKSLVQPNRLDIQY